MTQKQFQFRTSVLEPNNNKSLPIGTIAFVKEYLGKLGLEEYFNGLKMKGAPLFPLVCAVISYRLTENYSTEGCGRWLSSKEVRNELGIRKEISSRTINRAVELIGKKMPEILSKVRDSLFSLYELEHTDVNIDTTSVSVYSKQSKLFNFGYSRDKRPDLRQVNVGVVELRESINIPFHMTVAEGNTADPIQFVRMVDDIIGELKEDPMFVFDAGGDVKQALDMISEKDMKYVTRKKMNVSDDKWISVFRKEDAATVDKDNGVYCQRRMFESSGRTVYLFFSEKLYKDKMQALNGRAEKCVQDAKETMRMKADGTLRVSKTVIKRSRNPLISINVGVQGRFFSDNGEALEYSRSELSNGREGFFKLE